MPTIRNRALCWTWFNYPEDWKDKLNAIKGVKYVVGGEELCPTTGTPHIQGYIEFYKPSTWDELADLKISNIKPRIGTAAEAACYCKKDKVYHEYGAMSRQGARSDLNAATEIIKAGGSMRTVAEEHSTVFVKYHKGLTALKQILINPRNSPPHVVVLYGPTGTGKSRTAREITENPYVWGPEQGSWFDGYEGHSDVIFEEFRGQLPLGMMLRLLDRYDCRVQTKGSMTQFVATNIVITSPKHPAEWYHNDGHDKTDQLLRRICEITELSPSALAGSASLPTDALITPQAT